MTEVELEPHLHRAETGVRMRQKPSGSWELYGPLSSLGDRLKTLHHGRHAQRYLLTRQAMLALESALDLEPRKGRWFKLKKLSEAYLRDTKGDYPPLKELVEYLLANDN